MNPYSESQKPEFCPVKNTDTIVIFIHGIVEGPAQFKDLMKLGCFLVITGTRRDW